jgi:hypothetical protein
MGLDAQQPRWIGEHRPRVGFECSYQIHVEKAPNPGNRCSVVALAFASP